MAQIIKIEMDALRIQEIASEWMGIELSKEEAQKFLNKVKLDAQESLDEAAFHVISAMLERNFG